MRRAIFIILILSLFVSLSILGCTKKETTSQEAIESSKTLKGVEEQAKYLVSQANAFINSKEFDEAIKTAQYILANLDKNSSEAKGIIETAKAELKKLAESKADDVKNKIKSFGQ